MTETTRRGFITSTMGAAAAGALLSGSGASAALADELANTDTDRAFWRLVQKQFHLDPGLLYFNNASLGPSPALVADATENYRRMLDAHPSRWMWGGWKNEVEAVRSKAAELHGADPEEIALIHNTTEGMNLIAASLKLEAGDEIILGDHEHNSGTIPWLYRQVQKGVELVRPTLPILPAEPDEIVEVYRRSITPKTKVISICHVVNTNGMILPVKEISAMARKRGILVAVDGAQAPGHIPVDLRNLGCDFYAASSHKWLFSPKGVGVFYARKASQHLLKPLIVAYGWRNESIRRLENYNTRNLPEVLGLGAALDFQQLIGPDRRAERILDLKRAFLAAIEDNPAFTVKTPADDRLSAGIQTVEVVGRDVKEVATQLFEKHRIDCRPMSSHGLNGMRVSLSVFNCEKQIETLVSALREATSE